MNERCMGDISWAEQILATVDELERKLERVIAEKAALALAFSVLTDALIDGGHVQLASLHQQAAHVLNVFEEHEAFRGGEIVAHMREELDDLLTEVAHPSLRRPH